MPTMKKRQILKALALAIILFSAIWAFNIQTTHASKTLIVPQDYSTITSAVNHASQGDIIVVKQGVYYENIQINESISLQGENKENTIIMGNGGPNAPAALTLAAAGIKVSGFTIESDNNSVPTLNSWGVKIQGDNCTITGNIIKNNYIGIFCALQSSTTITDNTITLSIKDGIRFYSGTLNNISDNNIVANAVSGIALGGYANMVSGNNLQNNFRGLGLGGSNSVVFDNTVRSNVESGIFLSGSKNVINSNEISANKYGIYITTQGAAPRSNEIYQNNFVNNLNNAYGNSSFLVESWDNGSSGNYWSDYQSTPYIINSNNTDNYPLTAPFDTSNPGKTPIPISFAPATLNGVVASWTFDNITSGFVIPDSTGNNPAILASTVGNKTFTPVQVQGKFGSALDFDGAAYAFVPPSASLQTPQEVTIDAWVNVQQLKDVAYNNILVECVRTTLPLPTRTVGVAINGETPQNASSPVLASIRGYVTTQNGLNEIDTKDPIPLNQWIHVVFTRSLASGMHIYVNGQEQAVIISSGVANPTGPITAQNELYIGHDSITQIDQLQISNTVESNTPFWMQWWIWTAIAFAAVTGIGLMVYFKKNNDEKVKNGLMLNT
jgi:parallel beta-helix repeat protein